MAVLTHIAADSPTIPGGRGRSRLDIPPGRWFPARSMRLKVFDRSSRPGAPRNLRRSAVVSAALALVLVPISGSAGLGCDTSCDDGSDKSDPPVVYEVGSTNASLSYYESDSWDGPYLNSPPQRTYDFHHGLGRRPVAVLSYVGFSESPLGNGNGNISEAAGN